MADAKLVESLQKLAAYYRVKLDDDTLEIYVMGLSGYPYESLRKAVGQMIHTHKRMPMIADFVEALGAIHTDAWPTALQALADYAEWATDDRRSGVTFLEVETAWGQAKNLGDPTKFAAQKLFIEVYERLVREAKNRGQFQPVYRISEGQDKALLKEATRKALALGQITDQQASVHLPYEAVSAQHLLESAVKADTPMSRSFADKLKAFRQKVDEGAKRYDERKANGGGGSLFQPVQPGHSVKTGAVKGHGEFKNLEPA